MQKKIFYLIIYILCTSFISSNWSEVLKGKVDNAIKTTFEIETFSMEEIMVSEAIKNEITAEVNNKNLFTIKSNNERIGYAYIGKAPSMKNEFDYIIMFDTNLIIKKAKVLIYREDHGRQIGSQRWLKQFIGKSKKDNLIYEDTIIGISGATISASSMTKATNNVLKTVNILFENDIFKL